MQNARAFSIMNTRSQASLIIDFFNEEVLCRYYSIAHYYYYVPHFSSINNYVHIAANKF